MGFHRGHRFADVTDATIARDEILGPSCLAGFCFEEEALARTVIPRLVWRLVCLPPT
jgi:hypothetical protein